MKWLSTSSKETKAFELQFSKMTGKFLKEGELSTIDVDKVRVVLKRNKKVSSKYNILTAYPIDKLSQ